MDMLISFSSGVSRTQKAQHGCLQSCSLMFCTMLTQCFHVFSYCSGAVQELFRSCLGVVQELFRNCFCCVCIIAIWNTLLEHRYWSVNVMFTLCLCAVQESLMSCLLSVHMWFSIRSTDVLKVFLFCLLFVFVVV